jgi:hypothetical protein
MKDTYLSSDALYIIGRCKKHGVALQELYAIGNNGTLLELVSLTVTKQVSKICIPCRGALYNR